MKERTLAAEFVRLCNTFNTDVKRTSHSPKDKTTYVTYMLGKKVVYTSEAIADRKSIQACAFVELRNGRVARANTPKQLRDLVLGKHDPFCMTIKN